MERKMDFNIGANQPVFGGGSIAGVRGSWELPVNLKPTVMAAEIKKDSSESSEANGGLVAAIPHAETPEMIGQEELPLRSALAIAEHKKAANAPRTASVSSSEPLQSVYVAEDSLPPPKFANVQCAGGSLVEAITSTSKGDSSDAVVLQVRAVPGRSGRPGGVDLYPFAELTPITMDEHGRESGPCLFIPDADFPSRQIATARARHRDKIFITRKVAGGKMVWLQGSRTPRPIKAVRRRRSPE